MSRLSKVLLDNKQEAEAFLLDMGVSHAGARLMAEKCFSENILVRDATCAEANILKQEMLILGGDAAIHKDVITGKTERSDVLLIGNRKQIRKLAPSLNEQCFALPQIGSGLEKLIGGTEKRCFEFCGDKLEFSDGLKIMGILNVTPDSFSDGGMYFDPDKAYNHALKIQEDGADILDIGGESSRPGSDPVSVDEELTRVMTVLEKCNGKITRPISIDTTKPEVAKKALECGVKIVNDISGFSNPEMIDVAASYNAGIIIMHMQGEPKTMQNAPCYQDVVEDILSVLEERASFAVKKGIRESSIMIDPGIGFGKSTEDNLKILRRIKDFKTLGFPVLIGASRKSFIGNALGLPVTERLPADIAVTTYCALQATDMVRVHDVHESVIARDMVHGIRCGLRE